MHVAYHQDADRPPRRLSRLLHPIVPPAIIDVPLLVLEEQHDTRLACVLDGHHVRAGQCALLPPVVGVPCPRPLAASGLVVVHEPADVSVVRL